ncbi:MAG: M28 family peptidase [Sphingomonadaceae bacterium]|nr:M28 family peptidase [Sphingomonadaceae bacterium]
MRCVFLFGLLLAAPAAKAQVTTAGGATNTAWSIVEGLTTEVGQRLAGTEAEARARSWAVSTLTGLGFANVHVEPFEMPVWVRGAESGEIVAPYPQRLALTALGGSAATPSKGVTGTIVRFGSLTELEAAPDAVVRGRIVFVDHAMGATMDASSYGYFGRIRRKGPSVAARKGALAIVIRSIGTDRHRVPHTGETDWEPGVTPIPAAALSVPDAEQLTRVIARGRAVTLRISLASSVKSRGSSGNVIAEVPGRDPSLPIVAIGGHLDSWDLGTGAVDDGAGAAITAAAAERLLVGPKPLRTIRLVWFGAEEPGDLGGEAYGKAHQAEPHALVGEADMGADRVWQFRVGNADIAAPPYAAMAAALEPLGVAPNPQEGHGGDFHFVADATHAVVVNLMQDTSRYFEIHHTADDTLDKIDPQQLAQAADAWTAMLRVAANAPELPTTAYSSKK